jgi:aminoglycoside phosphotransferase (APT) family kinase protein
MGGRFDIDAAGVRRLLAEQFPRWADLPLTAVVGGGNDHHIFRLGDELSVRLPTRAEVSAQVRKEQRWLPHLAPLLPLPIPTVAGVGEPSDNFPAPWSVYGWMPGAAASASPPHDPERFAADLAAFLGCLRQVPPAGGPTPGEHSAYRGAPLTHGDAEVRAILSRVHGRERDLARGIWRDAVTAPAPERPVWFHGDVSANNLLVRAGRLAGVVDFGCAAVGDPACDTVFRWTATDAAARARFRRDYPADEATWARGRGWALWKGLIMITNTAPGQAEFARRVLDRVFAEG